MSTAEERAEVAHALRQEARDVLEQTGLFQLLQHRYGDPAVTGSASYNLMVWRDIDIELALDAERWRDWMELGGEFAAQLDSVGLTLREATYRNAHATRHPMGGGLSWSLGFEDFAGYPWTVSVWAWDPFDYAVRQAREFALRTDLNACDRDLILRLKTEARERPNYYGQAVSAYDIYQFAIAKAGDSLSALDKWRRPPEE